MDTLSYKTVSVNKENADKKWLLVDAEGQRLGRLCSEIARLLRGKHKVNFTPHADCGDYVIVINAEKVELTGNKWEDKEYIRFSGYPGGQYLRNAQEVRDRMPERLVENAVRGMLPKNRLGRAIFKNMHVYVGPSTSTRPSNPPLTPSPPILMQTINTSGRRKNAIARVYMTQGTGKVTINKRDLTEYFPLPTLQYKVKQPFLLTETLDQFDIKANLDGGGITGQAEALRLAISKALIEVNEELKPTLKAEGLTTRDPRMVERKKFGQKKARKKFQFSKR